MLGVGSSRDLPLSLGIGVLCAPRLPMGGYQTWGPPESWFDVVLLGILSLLSLAGIRILIAWQLTHVHP